MNDSAGYDWLPIMPRPAVRKIFVTNLSFNNLVLVLKEELFYSRKLPETNHYPSSGKKILFEIILSCLKKKFFLNFEFASNNCDY